MDLNMKPPRFMDLIMDPERTQLNGTGSCASIPLIVGGATCLQRRSRNDMLPPDLKSAGKPGLGAKAPIIVLKIPYDE